MLVVLSMFTVSDRIFDCVFSRCLYLFQIFVVSPINISVTHKTRYIEIYIYVLKHICVFQYMYGIVSYIPLMSMYCLM